MTTPESPAAERAELPEEPKRYCQMGSGMISTFSDSSSERKPSGDYVESKDYDALRTAAESITARKNAEIKYITNNYELAVENWKRRAAELAAALKEQRTQMDYPDLPPAFAATMKRMIDAALGKVKP